MNIKNIKKILILIFLVNCQQEISVKQVINSKDAPAAIDHYSQAIKVGRTLYCSGQVANLPKYVNVEIFCIAVGKK